jgi:hypothetical protein
MLVITSRSVHTQGSAARRRRISSSWSAFTISRARRRPFSVPASGPAKRTKPSSAGWRPREAGARSGRQGRRTRGSPRGCPRPSRVPPQHEQIAQLAVALLFPPALPLTELYGHAGPACQTTDAATCVSHEAEIALVVQQRHDSAVKWLPLECDADRTLEETLSTLKLIASAPDPYRRVDVEAYGLALPARPRKIDWPYPVLNLSGALAYQGKQRGRAMTSMRTITSPLASVLASAAAPSTSARAAFGGRIYAPSMVLTSTGCTSSSRESFCRSLTATSTNRAR